MSSDTENSTDHECRHCGTAINAREGRWFRHDWSEEKPAAEIKAALDEGREVED